MGVILALAIFVVTLRLLSQAGITPVQSLVVSGVATILIYPVVAGAISQFVESLSSSGLLLVGLLALVAAGGYVVGRVTGSDSGNPFKPW